MAKCGYSLFSPPVALTSNITKTALAVIAPASFGLEAKKLRIGLNGVSASGVPGLIELVAISAVGVGTAVTPQQVYGRTIAHGLTAIHTATTEPTSLNVVDSWPLTPNGGLVIYDYPLGDSPDVANSQGFAIRANFPAAVSIYAGLWVERI
ncbi:hypothetical protein [Streptosporangium saharense]|uniref:Uncharacterized protein n=1 Tax=Streptosporangium saharense TaxID=1706840 RepID=A0A7W7QK46_9ACTN|nr:hypothetical protein [Streptosporangium saharense]MBB4915080.1 hypothetical protein [Streptosporangium saharense]